MTNKKPITLKENYFRELYKEWDNIIKIKSNIKKYKDNCLVCNSKKILNIFQKKN